jgi:hypothetical protein
MIQCCGACAAAVICVCQGISAAVRAFACVHDSRTEWASASQAYMPKHIYAGTGMPAAAATWSFLPADHLHSMYSDAVLYLLQQHHICATRGCVLTAHGLGM